MMLLKLSAHNIRKSLRDYAVYFFTLIIGVSIFYVFNALEDQTVYLEFSQNQREMIELLSTMLSGISVFVTCVLGLLLVYASRFLIKRRKKEFAVYLTLGMGKTRISVILFYETLMIGAGSLIVGLAVGIGLSQLMSALVANLFEADMTSYRFTVSTDAIVQTILCLAIMYLVVIALNIVVIGKVKLIDLLQAEKKTEKIKLKRPVLCVLIFLIAAAILGLAYYQVGWNYAELDEKRMAGCIAAGVLATVLIFWSISGLLLRIIMSIKPLYYKGIHSFTFRQISSKVNTMVVSMSVICLMLFVIICALAASFSMRNSLNANLQELCPADCQLSFTRYADDAEDMYDETEPGDIVEFYASYGFDVTAPFEDYVHFPMYADDNFTFADMLGDKLDEFRESYPFLIYDRGMELVSYSDYNNLMQLYGKDPISMGADEFIVLCDFQSSKVILDDVLESGMEVTIFGKTLYSRYDECQDGFVEISAQHINAGICVVPDDVVQESGIRTDYLIGNYPDGSKAEKAQTEETVLQMQADLMDAFDKSGATDTFMIENNTRIDIYEAAIGLGAIVTFMGLYIGLVFLITCGAVLALKELSESVDSIGRYETLRKLGVEEHEISKSLLIQTGVFFLLPLLVASVHAVFGMKFAVHMLEAVGTQQRLGSILATAGIILLIYGGYFVVTYGCARGIIRKKQP